MWEWAASPPRALTLTLSRRAGEGMMVVDEGVGMVSVWLACHTSPGHIPLAALAPLSPGERGVGAVGSARREGTDVLVVWLVAQF